MAKYLHVEWPAGSPYSVEQVSNLGRKLIGPRHPSADMLEARLLVNPKCLALGSIDEIAQAYSLVYLLSARGTDELRSGEITGISELPLSEFATEADARSLYVGMVGAMPAFRLLAIRLLVWQLAGLLGAADGVDLILGRVATRQGGGLMARVGMQPVGGGVFVSLASPLRSRIAQMDPTSLPGVKEVAAAFRRKA